MENISLFFIGLYIISYDITYSLFLQFKHLRNIFKRDNNFTKVKAKLPLHMLFFLHETSPMQRGISSSPPSFWFMSFGKPLLTLQRVMSLFFMLLQHPKHLLAQHYNVTIFCLFFLLDYTFYESRNFTLFNSVSPKTMPSNSSHLINMC